MAQPTVATACLPAAAAMRASICNNSRQRTRCLGFALTTTANNTSISRSSRAITTSRCFATASQQSVRMRRHQCAASASRNTKNQARLFQSAAHPPLPDYSSVETTILYAALRHVPSHGFTEDALVQGAQDAGYVESSLQLFGGREKAVFELVKYHLVRSRERLEAMVEEGKGPFAPESWSRMNVEAKIKTLVWERLLMNTETGGAEGGKPIIAHWQDALGYMSLAGNIPPSITELLTLSSDILHLSSHPALSTSWYTARMSLGTVYAATELFMTTDSSPGYADTKDFLERRLTEEKYLTNKVVGMTGFVKFWAGTSIAMARSWGMKL